MKNLLKNKKTILILVLVLSVSTYFIFKNKNQSDDSEIQTTSVQKGTIVSSVSASGQIISSNSTNVISQASGLVKQVYVKPGDVVTKGQTIATFTLDQLGAQRQSQAYASYLTAKKNLASAQNQQFSLESVMWTAHEKYKRIGWDKDPVDPTYIQTNRDWLAAEANYKNQQTAVSQTQASLSQSWLDYQLASATVTAPISGTIHSLSVVANMVFDNSAGSSEIVATITTDGLPLTSFNLSEIDINLIKLDQLATITLDSIPDKTFTGQVVNVNKTGVVSSGVTQYPVIIQLSDSVFEILPNMAATANIITAKKDNILMAPFSAVQSQAGQDSVIILKSTKQLTVSVETGISSDTHIEIISGLAEGDLLVTSGSTSTAAPSGSKMPGMSGGIMRLH